MVRDCIPDIPPRLLYQKPTPPAVRNLLKGWGETVKMFHPDGNLVWVKRLVAQATAPLVVIDDMRFRYDYEYLVEVFGKARVLLMFMGEFPTDTDYDLKYFYTIADFRVTQYGQLD
jgi:hypothetical protein